jgi:hypothetical protein
VTYSQQSFLANNVSAPNTGQNYGPFNLGAIGKLTKVECGIAFSAQGSNLAPTALLLNPIIWGVQYGGHGYTPLDIVAEPNDNFFLWGDAAAVPAWNSIAWTPDTDAAAFIPLFGDYRIWRGQLPVNVDTDFYVSTGSIYSSVVTWGASLTLKVTYV